MEFPIKNLITVFIATWCSYIAGNAAAQDASLKDMVIQSYADQHSVSFDEAQSRLTEVNYINDLALKMERDSPQTFAGLYIENGPVYRVVVRFVGDADKELLKYTDDPLFVAEQAPRSLKLVRTAQSELAKRISEMGLESESSVDIKSSNIDLYVLDPLLIKRRLLPFFQLNDFIRLHATNGFMVPTSNMYGGQRITGNGEICTTGFNVVDVNRDLGITTAGHCANSMTYAPGSVALTFQSEIYSGDYDIQWHKQTSGTPTQQTNEIAYTARPAQTTPTQKMSITSTSSSFVVGQQVCKIGTVGKFLCGNIVNTAVATTDGNGNIGTWVQAHNQNNSALSIQGDSGGPVFGVNTAYGIIHARGSSVAQNDMFFMPIDRLSALGLNVITSPFEIETVPNVSGPHRTPITVKVNYLGYPKFPVVAHIETVNCPTGWTCNVSDVTYQANVVSPLTYTWTCNSSDPNEPSTTFRFKVSLKDASGIETQAVEYTTTCTP